ncbi:MAG TPA: GGDEF domain-containing protein [Urbifossiella sp.]|nr:GGDEF domain-containing protein [Urbifossiella sp.]
MTVTMPVKGQKAAAADSTYTEDAVRTHKTPDRGPIRGPGQTACLVHIYPTGPMMGTRYPLGGDPVTIGRTEDCEIQNTDNSVSRCHARIECHDDGRYRVTDLGSTNGTFVNQALQRGGVLKDGDYLRVGNCIYRFLAGGNLEAHYHEEIYRLTVVDGLTHVHNRRAMDEFLDRELVRAARHHRPLAVVLIDIDHFKSVNDKMGHLAGDMALQELCARVRAVVRRDELLARYGGEEFAVVLPEADLAGATATAERIRELVAARPFIFNDKSYPLTVSIGVAAVAGVKDTAAELLARVDRNLYAAKRGGRNRVVGG